MRIEDSKATGVSAPQTNQAQGSRGVERALDQGATSSPSPYGSDQVALSGLAARLSQALKQSRLEHEHKVEKLAAAYAAGNYRVNSLEVSRAIVAQMKHERHNVSAD